MRLPSGGCGTFACRWKYQILIPLPQGSILAWTLFYTEMRYYGTRPARFVILQPWSRCFFKGRVTRYHQNGKEEKHGCGVKPGPMSPTDKLFRWGPGTPGMMLRLASRRCVARGRGGKLSFLSPWLWKASLFCLSELTQCFLPGWILSSSCTLPLSDTEQSHPLPSHLATVESPFGGSNPG